MQYGCYGRKTDLLNKNRGKVREFKVRGLLEDLFKKYQQDVQSTCKMGWVNNYKCKVLFLKCCFTCL